MRDADVHVVGWGSLSKLPESLRGRWKEIVRIADRVGIKLHCIGVCSDGHPRHPLMTGYDTPMTEWPVPAYTYPYRATVDKNGEIWTGGMHTDRAVRLNPKTGETVEYQLPGETNMRSVFVDNSTTPVTFWTGSNHRAALVKVEPLD